MRLLLNNYFFKDNIFSIINLIRIYEIFYKLIWNIFKFKIKYNLSKIQPQTHLQNNLKPSSFPPLFIFNLFCKK